MRDDRAHINGEIIWWKLIRDHKLSMAFIRENVDNMGDLVYELADHQWLDDEFIKENIHLLNIASIVTNYEHMLDFCIDHIKSNYDKVNADGIDEKLFIDGIEINLDNSIEYLNVCHTYGTMHRLVASDRLDNGERPCKCHICNINGLDF